ncbi:MAG: TrkH family potassium uptake protein [Hyphomicrobiaceae bacterium]|nr:TrkH family potassium uptake protein [Hyphomicrobiaceae bacterium]
MVQFRPIVLTIGIVLCSIAAAMLLPAMIDYLDGRSGAWVFLASSVLSLFVGGLMLLVSLDDRPFQIGLKEGFVLTSVSWVFVAAFAAVPFVGLGMPVSDAFFESMSGLTTTGATTLTKLDDQSRGVLLWRSLLQGLGGLGIVVTALIVLPFLRVGGMQLFHLESSDKSDKVLPRALELVSATAGIYASLIVACATLFMVFGMTPFDAICHALTTVSTGGYSTHDASFGFFVSPTLQWICIVFMIAGSLPFVVLIRMLRGERTALWYDEQVRGYLLFLLAICGITAIWMSVSNDVPLFTAVRLATFHVVSVVTTTGFALEDYTKWGTFAVGLFLMLTFVGGCSGSTAGGIKIYRLQIAGILTRAHFLHLMSPSRVVRLSYNGRRLRDDIPFSVVAFLAIYMTTVGMFTLVLAAMGLDLVTALSGAATAVGNVGPGLGNTIGPAGTFASLPDSAKWVLSFAMMLGRLELFTVLVILRPEFWRG